MTLDAELRRSGRAVAETVGGGTTIAGLRRRRRRGRVIGAAAALSIATVAGVAITAPGADEGVRVDIVDKPELPRIGSGHGPTILTTAEGEPIGSLRGAPDPSDPVGARVLDELLDDEVVAARLADLGVVGSREARAAVLTDAGLVVETTVRADALSTAADATAAELPSDRAVSALVAVDPASGEIVALTGPMTLVRRQPGSAYLPVVMAAALTAGVGIGEEIPAPAQFVSGGPQPWTVANPGGEDLGTVTLAEALAQSANTPWAVLLDSGRFDVEDVAEAAERLGVPIEPDQPLVSATILGVLELSPLDLARAYATFASSGRPVELHTIRRVRNDDGEVLYDAEAQPALGEPALDPEVVVAVRDAMEDVICCGTGTEAALADGSRQFGMAGINPLQSDAWFAGSTPSLTTVVWMGAANPIEPVPGLTRGGAPARAWKAFMGRYVAPDDRQEFP
jgi:membrane peptidoglycan carboxypeptidase